MAIRTTSHAVQSILTDYDDEIVLQPFIRTANTMLNAIIAKNSSITVSTELATEIETYLAAHYYSQRDQRYTSKSTGRASGSFQGQWGTGLENTDYGQQALDMINAAGLRRKIVGVAWIGTDADSPRPDEDTDGQY